MLLRGANGAGKTSLLEGVTLALYGRLGLELVARAQNGDRPELSYDGFLERALNTSARGRDAKMSIEVSFITDEGELLSLERAWYFTPAGRHRKEDEEVHIRRGEDLTPVQLPADIDRDIALRAYVAEEILPLNLAPFFIFDGEHVDRLAGRTLDDQVRAAAELVLGAPELRSLAADLRTYARDRRRELQADSDAGAVELEQEVSTLEAEEQQLLKRLAAAAAAILPVRHRRDELVRRIGALHGDSYASFKALFEKREAHARERAGDQEELRKALSVDLALALCGEGLRNRAKRQLEAEALRDQWESTLKSSEERFDAFVAELSRQPGGPVGGEARERLRRAWDAVWSDRPGGAAARRLHHHLGEADRHLVVKQLEAVSIRAGDAIAALARRLETTDGRIAEIEAQISRQRGLDEEAQALADELRTVQESLGDLEAEHRMGVQSLDQLSLRAAPLKQELGRRLSLIAANAPLRRRIARAEAYARALEDLVQDALPRSLEHLASGISTAYRAMARKNLVNRVELGADGLRLLDSQGRDLRSLDASAGETQIFALALMAAVAASFPSFPILMDTPFARLDPEHRANVLRHFSSLGVQLVLLAHPAEVPEAPLAALGDGFAGVVEVEHEEIEGEIGFSRFFEGKALAHGA